MAHVTYNGITDNQSRNATTVNNIFAPFTTQSTNVGTANYADEGLDERAIAANALTDGRDSGTADYHAGIVAFVCGAYPIFNVLTPGGTAMSLTNGGVGWTVGQSIATLRAYFGTIFTCATPTPALYFKMQYKIDGGAYTDVSAEWRIQGNDQVAYNGAAVNLVTKHETFAFDWDIPFARDGNPHTVNEVRMVVSGGAGFSFNNTILRVKRYIKTAT